MTAYGKRPWRFGRLGLVGSRMAAEGGFLPVRFRADDVQTGRGNVAAVNLKKAPRTPASGQMLPQASAPT